ncbi:MAG: NADH-quinone oxidoreductase subunit NuoE, partial [Enterobacteriaceae bacterium]
SIEALKLVQKAHGWVPDGALDAIARILGIPVSDVEGVATFYSQIFRQPVGRHVIRYCDSVVCYITGYEGIEKTLEHKLQIGPGQTTADGRFTLLPVCCLGNCDKGPTMMIDEDTHSHLRPEDIEGLLEQYP